MKGPLEAGFGIIEGAGSLIKKTFAGTCDSFNKIFGSLANGISLLSLDS